MNLQGKIIDLNSAVRLSQRFRKDGKTIGFTNGCFDILHAGHVLYLSRARSLVDVLFVGLNSDRSVKRIKGHKRPINSQEDRAVVLAGLFSVDWVIVFDEDTPIELIKAIKPHVLIKGADWRGKGVVGSDYVKNYGGRVEFIDFLNGRSTTGTIEKIVEVYCGDIE